MSDDGVEFGPHIDASFLVVDELRAARLHQRGRQPVAADEAGPDRDDRRDHPRATTRTAPTTGSWSATATPPLAPGTRSSASSTAGARSPGSSPRSSRARPSDEDHDHRVRHARRRLPGARFRRRRTPATASPAAAGSCPTSTGSSSGGPPSGSTSPTACCSAVGPTRRSRATGRRSPTPTTRSPSG